MAATDSSTIRRRRLGHELRRLREAAGVTVDEVTEALDCSRAKISRIEGGRVGVRPAELVVMLDRYGVTDQDLRDGLVTLARESRRQTDWWTDYGSRSEVIGAFIGFEMGASAIRTYDLGAVPGLLQTEDYARMVLRAWNRDNTDPGEIERLVTIRMTRQKRLVSDDRPEFLAVLDEGALRRMVGGRAVMRSQLHKLLEAAEQSRTRIQVLPFSVGTHSALTGSFMVLHFPHPADPAIVVVEAMTSLRYVDKPAEVARYNTAFDDLRAEALSTDQSIALISSMAKEL